MEAKINKTVSLRQETWQLFVDAELNNFSAFIEECIWDSLGNGVYRKKKAIAAITKAKEELEQLGCTVELNVQQEKK